MTNMEHEEGSSPSMMPDHTAPTKLSDAELIVRMRQREEGALAALYDRYSRLVYTIALRVTSDPAVAEEVVEEVFQALWQATGSVQPERQVVAWLIGLARYRAIAATHAYSSRARGRETMFDQEPGSPTESTETHATPRLLHPAVRQALHTLPAAHRQTLELAYYHGLSSAEIARQLATPIGIVKSRIRLGLLKLREGLRHVVE